MGVNEMAVLADVKIVDLKRSVIDKEKSDPKKHRYVFTDKKYVGKETYVAENIWFSWCGPYALRDMQAFEDWRLDGWEPVRVGEDPYYVEGATQKDGYWTYKDVVLMKCTLDDEAKRGEQRIKMAGGGRQRLKAFAREVDNMDPEFTRGAGIGPDEMEHLRGRR